MICSFIMISISFSINLAWSLYFLGISINSELPWVHCNNKWNTKTCFESTFMSHVTNRTNETVVVTVAGNRSSPADEYFQ